MHGNSSSKEDPLRRCDAHPHRTVHIERCSRTHQVGQRSGVHGEGDSGLVAAGVRTLFIQPGSPWENGYNESFNGKLRDELLNGESFYSLKEVQILTERWRQEYNTIRPHSSLGYRPPAPETIRLKQAVVLT